jgi:RHS repeat-associated protein
VIALTDQSGTIVTQYSYEPYGNTTASGVTSLNPFQYTGRENDQTGLYYYRNRYYSPVTGRFIAEDPIGIGGGINTYAYVGANPISFVDPRGLWGVGPVVGGSIDGGIVVVGAGATAAGGAGMFWGGQQGVNVGAFGEVGAFAGGPGYGPQYPAYPEGNNANVAGGAFAGFGGGAFLTNACSAGDLRGPFDTYNFNVGVGPIQVSLQIGVSGATWIGSVTFGPGAYISGSGYPTNTWATGP